MQVSQSRKTLTGWLSWQQLVVLNKKDFISTCFKFKVFTHRLKTLNWMQVRQSPKTPTGWLCWQQLVVLNKKNASSDEETEADPVGDNDEETDSEENDDDGPGSAEPSEGEGNAVANPNDRSAQQQELKDSPMKHSVLDDLSSASPGHVSTVLLEHSWSLSGVPNHSWDLIPGQPVHQLPILSQSHISHSIPVDGWFLDPSQWFSNDDKLSKQVLVIKSCQQPGAGAISDGEVEASKSHFFESKPTPLHLQQAPCLSPHPALGHFLQHVEWQWHSRSRQLGMPEDIFRYHLQPFLTRDWFFSKEQLEAPFLTEEMMSKFQQFKSSSFLCS